MSKDLEFHYVISYREGHGWDVAADVENACLPDGTIYKWGQNDVGGEWFFAYEDSDDEENLSIADLDSQHYRVLKWALARLNDNEEK